MWTLPGGQSPNGMFPIRVSGVREPAQGISSGQAAMRRGGEPVRGGGIRRGCGVISAGKSGGTSVLGMRRVTQVLTAADSAAAPATNVPVCSLSNPKRTSPNFIGQGTPLILHPVPYETYKYQPFIYMNICTIVLPDGIWGRSITWSSPSRPRSLRQGSGRRCASGPGRIRPSCPNPTRSET